MPWFVGVDLGQASDWTAIACVEGVPRFTGRVSMRTRVDPITQEREQVAMREVEADYLLRHLERPALGTSYVDIVARVKSLLGQPQLAGAKLCVDATGVGRAVVDMLDRAGCKPLRISIHGGQHMSCEGGYIGAPKRDLAGTLQALFSQRRLKIAHDIPLGKVFSKEINAFRLKISTSGHDTYEALRDGDHDDLILAVAMPVWYAERVGGGVEAWAPVEDRLVVDGGPEWAQARIKHHQELEIKRARERDRLWQKRSMR